MFYFDRSVADIAEIQAFVEASMISAGYTKDYEVGNAVGFKITNEIVETGSEAFFTPIFIFNAGEVVLTLARETTTSTATGLIPEINAPKISSLVGPFQTYLVATSKGTALQIIDAANTRKVLVAATIDYRVLDTGIIDGTPAHRTQLRNNGQCVFGSDDIQAGRLLYAGTIANQALFNEQMTLDNLYPNVSPRVSPQSNSIPVGTVMAMASTDKFFGQLSGIYLTKSTPIGNLDIGVDTASIPHRCLRDSDNGQAILVREV